MLYLINRLWEDTYLKENYRAPDRRTRECKYWWFDGWDWIINRALSLSGSPKIPTNNKCVAVDPHVHSLFSHCSISQPERMICRAVSIGLGAVVVMDHNDIRGSHDAARCADDLKAKGIIPEEFLIIPGVEINSNVGHIGALFVDDTFPKSHTPEETVRMIHEAGGLAVAVHPYHSTGIKDAVFDAPFDAVEVECGSVFGNRLIQQNRDLATDPRLADVTKFGSSDAHYINAIGSCYTVIENLDSVSLESIRQAIIDGRTSAYSTEPCRRIQRMLGGIPKLK